MTKGEVRINITIPHHGYRRNMFFNRFAVQRLDSHSLIHFGLVEGSGFVRDHLACLLSSPTLSDVKESLLGYLKKIGPPQSKMTAWIPPLIATESITANVINMAYTVDAEISLCSFAAVAAIQKAKSQSVPFDLTPIALLKCDLDVQRALLAELYSEG